MNYYFENMNSSNSSNTSSSGITFTGLLQITFIVLKLTGVITWSWWLVLLPAIISVGLIVLALIILGIVYMGMVE